MNRSRPMTLPALLAVLTIVLAACAGGTASPATESEPPAPADSEEAVEPEPAESEPAESEPAAGSEERVRIAATNYDPRELTIAVGTEVAFVNEDVLPHTVTEGTDGQAVDDPITDQNVDPDGTVRVTFDEPGTYEITCKFHPTMQMTITVEG